MRRALHFAELGMGLTSPNPPVGAVVVKDGKELGGGWHRGAGQPHAEVEALRDASRRHGESAIRGATVYVSLEPCSTHGRTGPCTKALAEAGIKRVVIGAGDPNPAHEGRAAGILSELGIDVVEGIEEANCAHLIRGFAKVQRTGLPWLIIKSALSLDGRITRVQGEGQWLSGPESRNEVQQLRREVDAIISSGETVRADNPRFTLRNGLDSDGKEQPWRIILTSRENSLPEGAEVMTDAHADRTLVYRGKRIECVLRELVTDYGVVNVMVEAGGRLVGRLLDEGWGDEVVFYLAPLLTGGMVPASGGEGVPGLAHRLQLEAVNFRRIAGDVRVRALIAGTGDQIER